MPFPPHTDASMDTLRAVARRHGLPSDAIDRLPDTGIFNAIYVLGDEHILRVPRQHPAHYQALYHESVAVPLARSLGIRTPALLVYDDSRDLLPVPYTIYDRVRGETLGLLGLEPDATPEVWRELGRDLARLHSGGNRQGPGAKLDEREILPDPRELAEALAGGGWVTESEATWLTRWLDRIAPVALTPIEFRLSHGDMQATNVMVHPDSHQYVAVIDWGSAGWGDPAWDFAGVPLRAVPSLLEGHREVALLEADETMEARILWRQVQLALFTASRGPQPEHSWAERPLTMLIEIARFFCASPSGPWRELRPDS